MANYMRVIAGARSTYALACYEGGYIGINYNINTDLKIQLTKSSKEFNDFFITEYLDVNKLKKKKAAELATWTVWFLFNHLQKNDIILTPDGKGNYYVGEIVDDYYFVKDDPLPHQRRVKWSENVIKKYSFSEAFRNSVGAGNTVIDLNKYTSEIEMVLKKGSVPSQNEYKSIVGSIKLNQKYKQLNENFELSDLYPINYFVGTNGSGKSSLIELLYSFFNQDITKNSNAAIFSQYNLGSEIENVVIEYDSVKKINLSVISPSLSIDPDIFINTELSRDESKIIGKYHINRSVPENSFNSYTKELIHSRFYSTDLFPILRKNNIEQGQQLNSNIERRVKTLFKTWKNQANYSFDGYIIEDNPDFENKVADKDDYSHYKFNTFASGLQHLYKIGYFIFDILLRNEDMSDFIICIEEPEHCLHPNLQKQIPHFLEFINKNVTKIFNKPGKEVRIQFFVTTHSPFIISGAANCNVKKSENHKVYIIQDGNTANYRNEVGNKDNFTLGSTGYIHDKIILTSSNLLGMGFDDFTSRSKSVIPKTNLIIFCEGGNSDKSFKDEDIYNYLIRTFLIKSQEVSLKFVSCGSCGDVIKTYELLSNAINYTSNTLECGYILDGDNHVGDKGCLRSYSIENYLYHPVVLNSILLDFPDLSETIRARIEQISSEYRLNKDFMNIDLKKDKHYQFFNSFDNIDMFLHTLSKQDDLVIEITEQIYYTL